MPSQAVLNCFPIAISQFGLLGCLYSVLIAIGLAYCLWHAITPNDYQAKRIYASQRRATRTYYKR